MSASTAPALTTSLVTVMENLVAMENLVEDGLRVYMWRPSVINTPAIFNSLPSAPFNIVDQGRWRDSLTVVATLVVRHNDVEIEMDRLMRLADAFREVVDQELYAPRPLGAHRARRVGMNSTTPIFEGVGYQGFDFPLLIEIDRPISPR